MAAAGAWGGARRGPGGAGIVRGVEIEVRGSGGDQGWPAAGCRCASCRRAAAGGRPREAFRVVVDGVVELPSPSPAGVAGYEVRKVAGGWEVTGPDGTRLLIGARPEVGAGAGRYDAVLLDLVGDPAQLGRLRRLGAVDGGTLVLAGFADHRVRSEGELERRCSFWGAVAARDGAVHPVPGAAPGVTPPRAGAGGARRVLVLGGAGSGKSAEAELRLAAEPEVTYLATGRPDPADREWTARIDAHRRRRPRWWRTVETADLAGALGPGPDAVPGAILVDSVTTWLAGAMDDCGSWAASGWSEADGSAARLAGRVDELLAAWRQADGYVVAVSDETGLGVIPDSRAVRLFRDELGRLNQRLAAESEEFVLVVAGRPMAAAD